MIDEWAGGILAGVCGSMDLPVRGLIIGLLPHRLRMSRHDAGQQGRVQEQQ